MNKNKKFELMLTGRAKAVPARRQSPIAVLTGPGVE